jgi:3-phosphoshikimate 1-carboxyvinyltransferase
MNSNNSPYKVSPGPFHKTIRVPTSKSYANRLLILAALSEGETLVEDVPDSTDVLWMLKALERVGLQIKRQKHDVVISGCFPTCETSGDEIIEIETGDGGTTNRFLAPFLAKGKRTYRLLPSGPMQTRPMNDLVLALRDLGVRVRSDDQVWLEVQGPLRPKTSISCPSGTSTQFASGLLLALADTGVDVVAENLKASEAYWLLTKKLVQDFRAGCVNFRVPVDMSSLSYPLALALVSGEVTVSNCSGNDIYQADGAFLEIIKKMGGQVVFEAGQLKVLKAETLAPIDLDCSGHPDLVPTLCYVCAYADGTSVLRNLEVLRHKESDRIEECLKLLALFGVEARVLEGDHLQIVGPMAKASAVDYLPPKDHRLVMTSYLFMRTNSGGVLFDSHHADKSYPSFFKDLS